MNSPLPHLIPSFVTLLGLILILCFGFLKNRRLKKIRELQAKGDFIGAVGIASRSSIEEAIELAIDTPPGTQVMAIRRIERDHSPAAVESTLLRMAKRYQKEAKYDKAVSAFVLSGKIWSAASVLLEKGVNFVPDAVKLLELNPTLIRDKEQAVRNLAKYAYDRGYYEQTAELLRTIGANEEADVVLIASKDILATTKLTSPSESPDMITTNLLDETRKLVSEGNLTEARNNINAANNMIRRFAPSSKEEKKWKSIIKERGKLNQALETLDSARRFLQVGSFSRARVMYEEFTEIMGDATPATILAEIGYATENTDPSASVVYYQKAAERAQTPQAKDAFSARAAAVGAHLSEPDTSVTFDETVMAASQGESLAQRETCSVCRMQINTNDPNVVRCESCGAPAHFPHLAEWLKIRGTCPICGRKTNISLSSTEAQ